MYSDSINSIHKMNVILEKDKIDLCIAERLAVMSR